MATTSAGVRIRSLAAADRAEWERLWTGYLDFYETILPPDIVDAQFARLLAGGPFRALVAEADGGLVGLAHCITHPHGWRHEHVCYLQDLFADPAARGAGVGRALIEAVYAAADAAGTPHVYWVTDAANATARRLYDRIGAVTPFIKYVRPS